MQQLLLWEEPLTEEVLMRQEISALKDTQNNLRRGLFQRFESLHKEFQELQYELGELKKQKFHE